MHLVQELDPAVDHGMLGRPRRAILVGQDQQRALRQSRQALKIMDEGPELLVILGCVLGYEQAVEDQEARLVLPHLAVDHPQEAVEPLLHQGGIGAHVVDGTGHGFAVEEAHRAHVVEHAVMRLGQQRQVERLAAVAGQVEAQLIGEHRLAGPGRALQDIGAAGHQPAAKHGVEPVDTGRDAILCACAHVHLPLPSSLVCGT